MNSGISLVDLAKQLEEQRHNRKDYIAPQGNVEVKVVEGEVVADIADGEKAVRDLRITPHAHGQLAQELGIPKAYYDRMLAEQPKLLTDSINTWLHDKGTEKNMIRTLHGQVRAFMSPKYRPLDNVELAENILPALVKKGAKVMSTALTETRLYIKVLFPQFSDELPEGLTWGHGHNMVGRDGRLVSALTISNSDVGNGALRLEPSVFTTWCTNLAVMKSVAMKKHHIGRAFDADENFEIYRDDTRAKSDEAFWLKTRDALDAALTEDVWRAAIAQIREAGKVEIVSTELPKVVETTVKELQLPQGTANSILTHLAKGGDLTKWGLSSAITRVANDQTDYELSTLLERAGGEVLALPERDWNVISRAGLKDAA